MYSAMRNRVQSASRRFIAIAASGVFAGCSLLSGPKWSPAVAFAVHPASVHMLSGDTTGVHTWSCQSGGRCGDAGAANIASNWTIAGGAVVAVVAGGAVTNTVLSRTRIVLRGLAMGASDITAVASGDSTLSQTIRVIVSDSAAIRGILMFTGPYKDSTVSIGRDLVVFAALMDSRGTRYTTHPTHWSVSDTAILELRHAAVTGLTGSANRNVRGRKTGSAYVIASFLDVQNRFRITVTP